jgi:hypothetical protein
MTGSDDDLAARVAREAAAGHRDRPALCRSDHQHRDPVASLAQCTRGGLGPVRFGHAVGHEDDVGPGGGGLGQQVTGHLQREIGPRRARRRQQVSR